MTSQRVATALLEHLGFEVDIVVEGTQAVRAAALTTYRAILMDCGIPGLDGYQATQQIRRLKGPSRRTRIIAVTASATESDRQRCLAAGMDDHLAKPLSLKTLAAMLTRWAPEPPVAIADDRTVPVQGGGDACAPPTTDAGCAVLDAHIMARLERLGAAAGHDLVGQLAALFLADADTRLGTLRQALADNDTEAVAREAHTLSGSSASLGATDLARLCGTLAADRAVADLPGRRALFDGIEDELGRVRSALASLVATT